MNYNGWSIYWLAWLVIGFGGPEFWALGSGHQQNTLSYQVWHVEGQGDTFARYFMAAFLLWLFLHMVFEWFR